MKIARILILITFALTALPAASLPADDLPEQYCLVLNRWKYIYNRNGITVYSQRLPDSDIAALKAVGTLDAPIDQVMEVLRNVEISKEWVPHINQKYAVQEFSDTENITYSVNVLPWPFSDRSLLLHNKLSLDKEKKSIVIDVRSVDPAIKPIKEDNVRANVYCGQMILQPAGQAQTNIQIVTFLDPKGYIPAWLVNLIQKTLPYDFFKALEKRAGQTHYQLRPAFAEMLEQLLAQSVKSGQISTLGPR